VHACAVAGFLWSATWPRSCRPHPPPQTSCRDLTLPQTPTPRAPALRLRLWRLCSVKASRGSACSVCGVVVRLLELEWCLSAARRGPKKYGHSCARDQLELVKVAYQFSKKLQTVSPAVVHHPSSCGADSKGSGQPRSKSG